MSLKTLGTRSLVAFVFIPLIVLATLKGKLIFAAMILTIVVFSILEFYDLLRRKITNPQIVLGIVFSISICAIYYFKGPELLWLLFTTASLLIICIELFRKQVAPSLNASVSLFGLCYIPLLFGQLILIRELPFSVGVDYPVGGLWILQIFFIVWLCDTASYAVGSKFGRHKLYERISSNKTWEGTVAGVITAVLAAWAFHAIFATELSLGDSLVIGVICGIFGQISDLVESLFKRDVQVKDASSLIPGHGGMLDRFDSPIIIAPLVYLYLRFVVFGG